MIVAVLGLGSIGTRHALNLIGMGYDVLGFDPHSRNESVLKSAGVRLVTDSSSALAEADVAIIALPNKLHYEAAIAALTHDCHVLVEKPFVSNEEEASVLIEQASKERKILAVAHNMRFHPAISTARDLIKNGSLGCPIWARFLCSSYLPAWRPEEDYRKNYTSDPKTGGVIFDVIHEFDLAYYLLGSYVTEAAACRKTGRLDIPVEDCADVILRHDQGAQSSLHLDYATQPSKRQIEVAGENGVIEIDLLKRTLQWTTPDNEIQLHEEYPGENGQTYEDEIKNFMRATSGEEQPCCPASEAIEVLVQVFGARQLCGLPHA